MIKNSKIKVGGFAIISKNKNIFAKEYIPNQCEKVFVIKKLKIEVPWKYVIKDINGEEIIGTLYKK